MFVRLTLAVAGNARADNVWLSVQHISSFQVVAAGTSVAVAWGDRWTVKETPAEIMAACHASQDMNTLRALKLSDAVMAGAAEDAEQGRA